MFYPDDHYAEQERQQARWARDDAMRAMRNAVLAQRNGNTRQADRFMAFAYEKICDAEYHESRI